MIPIPNKMAITMYQKALLDILNFLHKTKSASTEVNAQKTQTPIVAKLTKYIVRYQSKT